MNDVRVFAAYLVESYNYMNRYRGLRGGQSFYNVLSYHRPDLAQKIAGTEFDPYYDDKNIPAFLEYVGSNW
jgi:hypothetical protein